MNSIMKMNLSDIIIPSYYSKPNPNKLRNCRKFYQRYGVIDRDIVVNQFNVMVDGYVGYLVLKENDVEKCEVISIEDNNKPYMLNYREMPTTYIYARHISGGKEYCWRMTNKTKAPSKLSIGSRIIVNTKNGNKVVTVTRIETLNKPPVNRNVKKVIRCLPN